jgi:dTDP-4-dehydrorhamnose 3,5-epimerase
VSYQADLASGIRWNDEKLNIDWNVENPIISERDERLALLSDFNSPFQIEKTAK